MKFIKKHKKAISIILAIWFALGFMVGSIASGNSRSFDHKTGCVYKSVAAFLNPGYLAACELFRQRFEIEGF